MPRFSLYSSRLLYSILYLSVPVCVRVCVFVYSYVFSFVFLCVRGLLFYFHPDFSLIHIPPLIICPFRQVFYSYTAFYHISIIFLHTFVYARPFTHTHTRKIIYLLWYKHIEDHISFVIHTQCRWYSKMNVFKNECLDWHV